MQLRPYQSESLDAITAKHASGVSRQLLVLPTGGGKTVVFAELIRRFMDMGKRALVLAHRDRLIQQAVEKIARQIRVEQMGVVKAELNRHHAQCVIASVQTLARARRLRQLRPFDLVIIDEAHRSAAKNYQAIIDHVCDERTLLLGVTATPDRSDGIGLIPKTYQEIVYSVGMVDLIKQGHLVDIRVTNVGVPLDLSGIRTQRGTDGERDIDQNELALRMDASNWDECVIDAWLTHARDRRTIIFVPRVALAYRLAESFRAAGIYADALDGSTALPVQRASVQSFERGTTQVLINCDLFVEGADIPSIDCVVLARPTKSKIVKLQAIGRGTRLSPGTGKRDLLVLDLVAAVQPGLCTVGDALGTKKLRIGESLTEAVAREAQEQMAEEAAALERAQISQRTVDLFGEPSKDAAALKKAKGFDWQVWPALKEAALVIGTQRFIVKRVLDEYIATASDWQALRERAAFDNYFDARDWCETKAKEFLFAPDAAWRNTPASAGQLKLLDKFRVRYSTGITKGEASGLIERTLNSKRQAKGA